MITEQDKILLIATTLLVRRQLIEIFGVNHIPKLEFPDFFLQNMKSLKEIIRFQDSPHSADIATLKRIDNDLTHSLRAALLAASMKLKEEVSIFLLFHDLPEIISGDVGLIRKKDSGIEIDSKELVAAHKVFKDHPHYLRLWTLLESISNQINKGEHCSEFMYQEKKDFEIALLAYLFDVIDGSIFYYYHLKKAPKHINYPDIYKFACVRLWNIYCYVISVAHIFPDTAKVVQKMLVYLADAYERYWTKAPKEYLEHLEEFRVKIE